MRFKNLSKVTWLEGQSLSGPASKLIPLCHPAQLPEEASASHMHAQSLRLLGCKTGVTGSGACAMLCGPGQGQQEGIFWSWWGRDLGPSPPSCSELPKKKNEALDFKFLKDP